METSLTIIPLSVVSGNYCVTEHLRTMGNAINEMKRCFGLMGYDVSSISDITQFIMQTTPINELRGRFNNYDAKIYSVTHAVDFKTRYTLDNVYIWARTPTDIRNQLRRWFSLNNYMRQIILDADENVQPLCDSSSELTTDINGDIIYVEVN